MTSIELPQEPARGLHESLGPFTHAARIGIRSINLTPDIIVDQSTRLLNLVNRARVSGRELPIKDLADLKIFPHSVLEV